MMDPRLQLAEAYFDELVSAPADQRPSLLAARCAGDNELRTLVEELLANDDSGMGNFLRPQVLVPDRLPPALPLKIGRYEIIAEIGRGGSGVVYEARQENPPRPVALKVINTCFASPDMLRRFAHEAEILGYLQHPGIAQIYEAGTAETTGPLGIPTTTPYFAMELVRGDTITQYAGRRQLGTRVRLELMAQVCDAVQYAHQRGVIHRDLKPANILVDTLENKKSGKEATANPFDVPAFPPSPTTPQPKILDFGIARATGEDFHALTMRTEVGQLVGTVPYMSPEQFTGDSRQIDTRSDVYALGVVLFELVSGAMPHEVAGRSLPDAIRIIRGQEPRLLGNFDRALRGEIETICAKAMHRDREQRYPSASALADDLRHYLAGEPIDAKCDSRGYLLGKQLRRHWVAVAVATGFVAILTTGLITSVTFWLQARDERDNARMAGARARDEAKAAVLAREQTEQVADFQAGQLADIDPQAMGVKLRADLLAKACAAAERSNLPSEKIDARMVELEKLITGSDFTGMALNALEENIFRRALTEIEERFEPQPLVQARLLQTLTDTQRELGLLDAATRPQEQALTIRRRLLGDEHPDTLLSINNMGELLKAQGKLSQAEPFCREAIEKYERVLGDERPETLAAINNLGNLLELQGRLPEAEVHYREALEKHRRLMGEEHRDTLTFLNNMASVLQSLGKLPEAEPLYREALEKHRRVLGEEHPNTLRQINNMASILKAQGKLTEAEPLQREALEKRRRVLGEEHHQTLTSINNMGFLLQAQGKLAEAEGYYREVLEKRRRLLGEDHQDTLLAIGNMGSLLKSQVNLTEAEPYYREALDKRRRLLGEDHQDTLLAIGNMGSLLKSQVNLTEAEPYYREALDKRRRLLGEEHPDTLLAINNMGSLLKSQGKLTESEPYHREAMEKHRRVLGDEHPDTLLVIHNMAALLRDQGKHAEARVLFAEALAGARRSYADDHPFTAMYMHHLAEIVHGLGEHEEAEQLVLESLSMYRRHAEWSPGEYRHALDILSTSCQASGRNRDAADALYEKLDVERRSLPAGSAELATALAATGSKLLGLKDYDATEDVIRECLSIRQNLLADDDPQAWLKYKAASLLGEAIVGRVVDGFARDGTGDEAGAQLLEAESLLLESWSKLKDDPAIPPATPQVDRKRDALERIVRLYDVWHDVKPDGGYEAKAAEWRDTLASWKDSSHSGTATPLD